MGLFDVLSGVTGRGEEAGSPPDAPTGDGSEGKHAVDREPGDLSPADFRERAETLAGRSDVPELDFTEPALADLDSMATGTHPVDDEITYGSYLGETLVREYGGEWVHEDGWRVAVALGDDETTVAVFDAARMGLERGPVFAQVVDRLHAQGDPYAEGTGEESVDETTAIDADADADVDADADADEDADKDTPATTDDVALSEPDGEDVPETDEGGTTDGETTGEEVTVDEVNDEFSSPDATTTASTADASATTAASDEPIDDDEAGVETTEDVDSDEGRLDDRRLDDGTSTDVTGPTADIDDDAERDPTEEEPPAAGEPASDPADPDDVGVGATATDPDASAVGELDTPERDSGTDENDEEDEETDDTTLSTTDGEDDPDGRLGEPAVGDSDDESGEDEAETDDDLDAASEPQARDEDSEDSSIIDARTSELGVGPDGPTEADFAREPFDRPSSIAAVADGKSVGGDTVNESMETEPTDESDEQESDVTTVDDETEEKEEERSEDSGLDWTITSGPEVDGTGADAPAGGTDDAASATSLPDDVGDGTVIGDEDERGGSVDDASGDEANGAAMGAKADGETVPVAGGSASAGSSTDADSVDDSPGGETATGGLDADEATGDSPTDADGPTAETASGPETADATTVDDDPDVSAAEGPDGESVMPSPDADAPSRSEYEPAAISLKNDWGDYDFDFTTESLARLDTFLDDQWAGRFRPGSLDDSDVDPDASGPLVEVGAYVGEVLIQHYDAQWVLGEDGEPALAIPGRHGRTETFPVFDVARTSLTENARVAYAVDALANRLDIATRASGAEETAFALGDEGPGTATSSADVITTILDRAEAFVASWPGYDLNYRPASLVRLDNLAKDELDREAFRATTLGDRTDPDALRLADRAAGASAYFAAVLVRHLDAQWEIDDEVALSVEGPAGETRVVPFEGSVDCLRGEASFMRRYDVVHDAVIDESRSTG